MSSTASRREEGDAVPAANRPSWMADCDDLRANGVELDEPLQVQPWGTEAVIRDPDGNRSVLQQA